MIYYYNECSNFNIFNGETIMKNENISVQDMLNSAQKSIYDVSKQVTNLETKLGICEKERSYLLTENERLERELRAVTMVNVANQQANRHTPHSGSMFQTPPRGGMFQSPLQQPGLQPNLHESNYRFTQPGRPGQNSSYHNIHPGVPLTYGNLALDNFLNNSDTFKHGDIAQKYSISGYKSGAQSGPVELVTHATITQVIQLINNSNERINSLELALADLQRKVDKSAKETVTEAIDSVRSCTGVTKKSDKEIEVALMKTLLLRHDKNSDEYRKDLSNLVVNGMDLLGITRISDLAALTGVDLSSLGLMRKAVVLVRVDKVAKLINKLSERLDIVIDVNSITVEHKAIN
jgi:hypothetical protein